MGIIIFLLFIIYTGFGFYTQYNDIEQYTAHQNELELQADIAMAKLVTKKHDILNSKAIANSISMNELKTTDSYTAPTDEKRIKFLIDLYKDNTSLSPIGKKFIHNELTDPARIYAGINMEKEQLEDMGKCYTVFYVGCKLATFYELSYYKPRWEYYTNQVNKLLNR